MSIYLNDKPEIHLGEQVYSCNSQTSRYTVNNNLNAT